MIMSSSSAATLIILMPLLFAVLAYLIGRRSHGFFLLSTPIILCALVLVLGISLWHNGAVHIPLGGWEAPLGIHLYADGLTVFMLAMTALVGSLVTLYSYAYYSDDNDLVSHHESGLFVPLWLFLWASLNAVFLSADTFNIYVVFEMTGISAIALITLGDKITALHAAMRYLIAAFIGSLLYLLGVAFLYGEAGTLNFFLLQEGIGDHYLVHVSFGLMATGLLLKTALFPLHFWLPPAHASASPPVSALLSALVIKASLYVFTRLWFDVFYGVITVPSGQFIGFLGALAIIWGSVQALRQNRLKLIVAHSTVAQVGYMFLLFPLTAYTVAAADPGVAGWLNEARSGFTYQVLSHALAKSSMFLAAGIVFYAYGTDKLSAMKGMSVRYPVTTFALGLSGVSLMGLPPSGGFTAKWLIMKAAIGSGQWWWIPVIVLGGLLTAGYVFLMLRFAFYKSDMPSKPIQPVKRSLETAALILAILAVLIGFRLEEPLMLLDIGSPFTLPEGGP